MQLQKDISRRTAILLALLPASAWMGLSQQPATDVVGVLMPEFDLKEAQDPFAGAPARVRKQMAAARGQIEESRRKTFNSIAPIVQDLWVSTLQEKGIRAFAVRDGDAKAQGATCLLSTSVRSWQSVPSAAGMRMGMELQSVNPLSSLEQLPLLGKLVKKIDPLSRASAPSGMTGMTRHVKAVYSLAKVEGGSILPNQTAEKQGAESKDHWTAVAEEMTEKVKQKVSAVSKSLVEPPRAPIVKGGGHVIVAAKTTMEVGKYTMNSPDHGQIELDLAPGAVAMGSDEGVWTRVAGEQSLTIVNRQNKTYSTLPLDFLSSIGNAWGAAAPEPFTFDTIPGSDPGTVQLKVKRALPGAWEQEVVAEVRTGESNEGWNSIRADRSMQDFLVVLTFCNDGAVSAALWKEILKLERPPTEINVSLTMSTPKMKAQQSTESKMRLDWSAPANPGAFTVPADYRKGTSPMLASLYF